MRHRRLDDGRDAARLHSRDPTAPAVQVTHQIAGELRRRVDLDVHDRLEQRWLCAGHAVAERQPARQTERHLTRIDIMIRAVGDGDPEIDDRVTGEVAAHPRVLDPLFDGRHELAWDRAAEDVVDELEIGSARQRLHSDLAVAELAVAAGLLLVTPVGSVAAVIVSR